MPPAELIPASETAIAAHTDSAGRAGRSDRGVVRSGRGALGVRIWLTNHVDFAQPINQMTAAIPLISGIADFTWQAGDLTFTGIALRSIAKLVVYHGMRLLSRRNSAVTVS